MDTDQRHQAQSAEQREDNAKRRDVLLFKLLKTPPQPRPKRKRKKPKGGAKSKRT